MSVPIYLTHLTHIYLSQSDHTYLIFFTSIFIFYHTIYLSLTVFQYHFMPIDFIIEFDLIHLSLFIFLYFSLDISVPVCLDENNIEYKVFLLSKCIGGESSAVNNHETFSPSPLKILSQLQQRIDFNKPKPIISSLT